MRFWFSYLSEECLGSVALQADVDVTIHVGVSNNPVGELGAEGPP
jgi:hypothetical protein